MKKPASVEEYINSAPEEVQEKLREIRKVIKECVPDAQERISYGMPYYQYKGRLAYFAYFKNHISLFAIPPIVEEHKEELEKYKTSKSVIQFPLNEDLPISLIKKLVKARIEKIEKK
jgi:uncharacterized protein YdhG (YjbR/CyaY superfamily)